MKILLADDHQMVRAGLRALLENAGLSVVGEATTGREAVALARELKPTIVIMDVSMPGLNGIDATKRLLSEAPHSRVIALSMHSDRRYVIAMFGAGAAGYLLKNAAAVELLDAVGVVARNLKYVSPGIADAVVTHRIESDRPGAKQKPLSPREREVLQLLAEGCSSKDIASRLELAVATVETHRRQIMDKLDIRTVAELTKYAIREGLTSLDP